MWSRRPVTVLSEDDRAFLERNFLRFGTAWSGGLAALEREFKLQVQVETKRIRLELTLRAPPRLSYTLEVTRKDGGMRTLGPALPDGPDLTADERGQVETILCRTGELWLVEPPNHEVRVVDLTRGLDGLHGNRQLETRRHERWAVLYFHDQQTWAHHFCLWLDLDAGALQGVAWVQLPLWATGRWLPPDEVQRIDQAMRVNGDFGVYGNVQAGFRSLATHMEVKLVDEDDTWSVHVYPRDGHGHFLHFPIDKRTGAIGPCAAGHMDSGPFVDRT